MKNFCAAFLYLQFGFVTFWRKNIGAKATPKMLMKFTRARFSSISLSILSGNLLSFIKQSEAERGSMTLFFKLKTISIQSQSYRITTTLLLQGKYISATAKTL